MTPAPGPGLVRPGSDRRLRLLLVGAKLGLLEPAAVVAQ